MSNVKKECSGHGCEERIGIKYPFCKICFGCLPKDIKNRLSQSYRIMDGKALMEAKTEARAFLKRKAEEKEEVVTTGKSNIVDVILEKRDLSPSGLAQAFFQGDYEEDRDGNEGEVWIWLPLSQIEVTNVSGDCCEVSMPEWLATSKELI